MKKVTSWQELTLREKIGQTVICLCETDKHIEMCGSIEAFLEKYPVGGIFNNGGLVKGLLVGANPEFKNIVAQYNKYLRVPLISTADNGSFASQLGISLPPQMSLGATDDPQCAYAAGEFIAEDCKRTGIDWIFWPVCDLNMSKHSPVMDRRCVSDNWELSTRIVKEEVRAMKDRGIIATLKHYPGTPHDEHVDPHLAPVNNETPMELWMATYGKMYKELFEAGVPTIMTGHTNLVSYQQDAADGIYPPATMSYDLTTKLLREELGFKGVTVTDALVMGGFCGIKAVENTVNSFLTGNDMLLWPAYEYIDEMERRILAGEIDEKILDAAVERIWNLKKEYGILDGVENASDADADFFAERVQTLSEKSLTLVQNANVLPLKKETIRNVYIVGVTPDDGEYQQLCFMKKAFEAYGCNVSMRRNAWTTDIDTAATENDLIVFALCRTPHHPIGPLDFWGEEATSIWASNCSDKSKTVIASFGTPYLFRYYKNSGMTYINAYTPQKEVITAFVKALFGEITFDGKSSVQL